jgi:hypothetical protein
MIAVATRALTFARATGPNNIFSLSNSLLAEVLKRAGPRSCARFVCCSRAAFCAGGRPECWTGVRGIGQLTLPEAFGLVEVAISPCPSAAVIRSSAEAPSVPLASPKEAPRRLSK